jgi:hydroxyacylglutathione hydrolase
MPSTTLGYERIANWAFQIDDEAIFVRAVTEGQPEPPKYFARMKTVNRDGPTPMNRAPLGELTLDDVRRAVVDGTPVIDVRATAEFARGHIPGTINIPTGTSFTTWAGSLLPFDRDLVLLADDQARIDRARLLLALIGFDRVAGFAGAAVRDAWASTISPLQSVEQMGVEALAADEKRTVIDVRGAAEWSAGHIARAKHLFLGDLVELAQDLPRDTPIALHCQGGTRSAIAASLLQKEGFTDVVNVAGGITEWERAGLPLSRDP